MSIPYFYIDQLDINPITLDEDTSKHMISVLRMQNGDEILLTDGRGTKARSVIIDDNRKKCKVDILSNEIEHEPIRKVTIAISITKNTSRFEWFLEKATEIGVNEIIPLICERTEKQKFRFDRMKQVMISAMLQSQQCWLPVLHEPVEFKNSIEMDYEKKLIAHCLPEQKKPLNDPGMKAGSSIILIGPEGDFTPLEIQKALQHNFIPVTLGNTRLRTETAGIAASVILCIG
jgi:16S rRNA (uracil1498-N3)-methyltransferase